MYEGLEINVKFDKGIRFMFIIIIQYKLILEGC